MEVICNAGKVVLNEKECAVSRADIVKYLTDKEYIKPGQDVKDIQEALMDRFYKELSAGRGRAEALRLAQLQLLRKSETSNFLYWSPVILSGDPAPLPAALFAR